MKRIGIVMAIIFLVSIASGCSWIEKKMTGYATEIAVEKVRGQLDKANEKIDKMIDKLPTEIIDKATGKISDKINIVIARNNVELKAQGLETREILIKKYDTNKDGILQTKEILKTGTGEMKQVMDYRLGEISKRIQAGGNPKEVLADEGWGTTKDFAAILALLVSLTATEVVRRKRDSEKRTVIHNRIDKVETANAKGGTV